VVYAPAAVGSLDFRHLGYEQGMQQVLQVTKHMQAQTTNKKLYYSLIDAYQIHTRVSTHILQDTIHLPWSHHMAIPTQYELPNNPPKPLVDPLSTLCP